jgi:ABC-type bacteriocin/lantibiotic exporter with double-glycine peptidase domain
MVNLLMRFYDVNRGQIRIDGKDIRSLFKDSLRRKMGMVHQIVLRGGLMEQTVTPDDWSGFSPLADSEDRANMLAA